MKRLFLLFCLVPGLSWAQTVTITSTDGPTTVVELGASGPQGATGPTFNGGTVTNPVKAPGLYVTNGGFEGGIDATLTGDRAWTMQNQTGMVVLGGQSAPLNNVLSSGAYYSYFTFGPAAFTGTVGDSVGQGQIAATPTTAYLTALDGGSGREISLLVDPKTRGIIISTSGAKPACASAFRGSFWRVEGGVGVADTFEVCAKNSSNNYVWYVLATIP